MWATRSKENITTVQNQKKSEESLQASARVLPEPLHVPTRG
jgi:hypothetical protein